MFLSSAMEGNWFSTSSSRNQMIGSLSAMPAFFNKYADLCEEIMNTMEAMSKKVKVAKGGNAKNLIDDINAEMTAFSDKVTNMPGVDSLSTVLQSFRKYKADMKKPEVVDSLNQLVRVCQPGGELNNRAKNLTERIRTLCELADKADNGNETDEERLNLIYIFTRAVNFISRKVAWFSDIIAMIGRT